MEFNNIKYVYLLGIGGIGMSALARYFLSLGKTVAGYDKTSTELTNALISEGIDIHFDDSTDNIPENIKASKDETLIIVTPAVPKDNKEWNFLIQNNFIIKKRAEVLGLISKEQFTIAVAGTHGKTTVTTMIAHILTTSELKCNAFLGGISKNYNSNLILSGTSDYVVVEADEYDRSFLQLSPDIAVITSMDADHLDIYEEKDEVIKSFNQFVDKIKPGGTLIIKHGLEIQINRAGDIKILTYSLEDKNADFHAWDMQNEHGSFGFDLVSANGILKKILPGSHGIHNAENALAACSVARVLNVQGDAIRSAIGSYAGVQRRFDYQIKEKDIILIDDYAHHPEEIKAFLNSVKKIYQDKKITGIFQPHLYSRTRDFYVQFAESLDLLDELILLDIYPAREKPIEGVTSELIIKNTKLKEKTLCSKVDLLDLLKTKNFEVLVMMGAGDIDTLVAPVKDLLIDKYKL